jgi:ubiquinone/menaquinone biosynthesis C-methylase UbiE
MALVISFVPDAQKAVAEMKRVVKPHGTVGAYMWDTLGGGFIQRPLVEAINAMNVEIPPSPLRRNSRIEEMRAFWQRASLEEVATRTIEIEFPIRTSTNTGPHRPDWPTRRFRPFGRCPNET